MDVLEEERLKRERRIRKTYRPKTPPGDRAQTAGGRIELPPLFKEVERHIQFTVAPGALKTAASLLTDFAENRDPGEYLQTNLPLLMIFFECIDRQIFLENVGSAFRDSTYSASLEWSIFAKCEFTAITYLIFFESARIPGENLSLILTEFRWEGARHFYRFLLHEIREGSELYVVMEMVYSPEYIREKILPNLAAVKNVLRRVINAVLLALNMPPGSGAKKRSVTVPKPFHFHVTSTKLIDYEIPRGPPQFRAQVVPKTHFISPRPSPRFEQALQRNKLKAENLLLEVNSLKDKATVYGDNTKSDRYLQSIARVKAQREGESAQRTGTAAPRIPLEKVFKGPTSRGKMTFSELLRQRQLCVKENQMRIAQIENFMVGRNEEKIRDYILHRNRESLHMEEVKRTKFIVDAKLSRQRAVAAPRRVKMMRQECARQVREAMRLEELQNKERREQALKEAREIASKAIRKEKLAEKKAHERMQQRGFQLAKENEEIANKRIKEINEERNKAEALRLDKLHRQRAAAMFRANEAATKETLEPVHKEKEYMSAVELSLRLDSTKREESERLAALQAGIQATKAQNYWKVTQIKKELEDCRSGRQFEKRTHTAPVLELPPIDDYLDPEIELMKSEFEALKIENEILSPKFRAQTQPKPARKKLATRRGPQVDLDLDSSARPSSASEDDDAHFSLSSTADEDIIKIRN